MASSTQGETSPVMIRSARHSDYAEWRSLWDGYNSFYGRHGPTALPDPVTESTWQRFFDPAEPVHALVAEHEHHLAGLAHYVFHLSTTRLSAVCYLQDLFTAPAARGRGIGRRLIEGVYREALQAGATRVYWHTQDTNKVARVLYDQLAKPTGFIVYAHELR